MKLFDEHPGIAIYELQESGNLRGRYTCTAPDYIDSNLCVKFFDEFNRKTKSIKDEWIGTYNCSYYDNLGIIFERTLTITFSKDTDLYHFEWSANKDDESNGFISHKGIGKLDRTRECMAVVYWS